MSTGINMSATTSKRKAPGNAGGRMPTIGIGASERRSKSIGQLVIELSSGNAEARKAAVAEIGRQKDKPKPNLLLKVAESDPDMGVRVEAMKAATETAINHIQDSDMVEAVMSGLVRIKLLSQFSPGQEQIRAGAALQMRLIMAEQTKNRIIY